MSRVARSGLVGIGLLLGCGDDLPDGSGLASTGGAASSGGSTLGDGGSTTSGASTADTSGGSNGSSSGSGALTVTDGGSTTGGGTSTGGGGTSTGEGTSTGTTSEGTSTGTTDPVTASSTGTTESDGSESSTTGGPGDPVCIDHDLGGALVTVFDDTTLAADDWDPPCAPGLGGRDRGHLFFAPVDGFYAFDTLGTVGLDTVLYAFGGDACDVPVVACNDDVALGQLQSRISMFLPQGFPVVVVVDGFDGTQAGPYALDIDAVLGPCAATDLLDAVAVDVVDDNTADFDKLQGSCVAAPGRDVVFQWIVPFDGTFVFDTLGSSFDTVLYLREGQCGHLELACNDDALGGVQSQIIAPLTMGTEVAIVVDGFGLGAVGPLSLHITAQ